MSLRRVFESQPDRRYIMFGGKGGLGKTTLSATSAYWLAQQGKRVLLFSVDPQASLSDIFQRDIFGKGPVPIIENLWAQEVDADRRIKDYQEEIRKKILDMYGFEKVPEEIDNYIQAASAEPAMEESAIFDAVVDIIVRGDYDYYIYDLVPLGHALYYLSMAKVYDEWINKITKLREDMRQYDQVAATMRREETVQEDQILSELTYIKDRINASSRILTDKARTAFFFVVVPEEMIRLLGIEEDHLLRHHDEEEGGPRLVRQDPGGGVDPVLDVGQLGQDLVLLHRFLTPHRRGHLVVLAHVFAELGDLVDPLVVHLRHRQVVERVAERHQIVDVVVVVAPDDDVDDGVEDRALLHRGLRRGGRDVVVDLLRHLLEPVHVEDLLPDLLLVVLDPPVGVDLLRPEVLHDRHGSLAEDVPLEDIRETRLRIDREQQDAFALLREPVGARGREGRLAQPPLAPEHDVPPIRLALEHPPQRHGLAQDVRHVAFPQHPPLPPRDLRRHVRQEPERVVGRQDRDPQEVAHRDQDEQVLHARPRAHGMPGHLVGGHPVDDVLEDAQNPALLLRLRLVRHGGLRLRVRAGRTRPFPRTPCAAPCAASTSRSPARRTGAAGASRLAAAPGRRSGRRTSRP